MLTDMLDIAIFLHNYFATNTAPKNPMSAGRSFEYFNKCNIVDLQNSTACVTWANNTSIFIVVTVVFSETSVRTVSKGFLVTSTLNIVQPNLILTSAVEGLVSDCESIPTVQFSAGDSCFLHAPSVITNRSPLPIMVDFHSARAPMSSIHQPNWFTVCQVRRKK